MLDCDQFTTHLLKVYFVDFVRIINKYVGIQIFYTLAAQTLINKFNEKNTYSPCVCFDNHNLL